MDEVAWAQGRASAPRTGHRGERPPRPAPPTGLRGQRPPRPTYATPTPRSARPVPAPRPTHRTLRPAPGRPLARARGPGCLTRRPPSRHAARCCGGVTAVFSPGRRPPRGTASWTRARDDGGGRLPGNSGPSTWQGGKRGPPGGPWSCPFKPRAAQAALSITTTPTTNHLDSWKARDRTNAWPTLPPASGAWEAPPRGTAGRAWWGMPETAGVHLASERKPLIHPQNPLAGGEGSSRQRQQNCHSGAGRDRPCWEPAPAPAPARGASPVQPQAPGPQPPGPRPRLLPGGRIPVAARRAP